MKSLPILCILLALPSCATISELYCSGIGDYGLGETFARDGQDFGAVQSEIAACRGTAAPISEAQARAGWEAGRAAYCTPSNARLIGRSGAAIGGICSPAERGAMAEPYRAGRLEGEIDLQLHTARARRDQLEERLDKIPDGDEDRRQGLRHEIAAEIRRIERLEDRRFLLVALTP